MRSAHTIQLCNRSSGPINWHTNNRVHWFVEWGKLDCYVCTRQVHVWHYVGPRSRERFASTCFGQPRLKRHKKKKKRKLGVAAGPDSPIHLFICTESSIKISYWLPRYLCTSPSPEKIASTMETSYTSRDTEAIVYPSGDDWSKLKSGTSFQIRRWSNLTRYICSEADTKARKWLQSAE